ncbi:OVARIAN TUMOR DOMAIN-containing deubiquitinating enzyme 6 isoform X1 [Spinacia oleracea]|uniref:ubiquitinyl hydrolase 1 n=1 Tax=Spinacia oleracea TaxID=3562 RepID=A0ABM3QKS8_SPIOL|nr:OVARIAN TUMOR DOMAIN-containing deubiquitinating enzyme 6 isoform X1 [Spinacia oleracea]XP_056683969.1 OVARIAN TUMOR DOMAIN-containing deubiquitinating enzyme 6 isoform X1 [Spinacia oleracea]XP_056683970.1 OVARIAN TUMOR DOMAIN-containing deubiquitinating enzyme 6 isoform X1 [Spinacia oleracea]XP_056683971.1 OVARIAN TUMOR DOMAIN-containing deubiquitinating enzyme 6 isoform X1 [Spinacia oleracea]
MTRILVPRGSSGSSSSNNQTRTSLPSSSNQPIPSNPNVVIAVPDEVHEQVIANDLPENGSSDDQGFDQSKNAGDDGADDLKIGNNENQVDNIRVFSGLKVTDHNSHETDALAGDNFQSEAQSSQPPPPPIPPPKPSGSNSMLRRFVSGTSDSPRIGPSRRPAAWPAPARTSPSASRPSSPRSHCESEGYNSADEQIPSFGSSYYDLERERQFEIDIRRAKGLEVKRMQEDGNCLFRAVADQVYGDSEAYDLIRQMCIDYMERERDHFSQFITEGFTSYCKRKRRDKVYGNNVEIQALSEMYNRPIHIYSYSTEPINIFHGNYDSDVPPIRLSYHHGNHYNSLVDPRRLSVGAGLGFSCLRGRNVDKDQVKAAIKAQQDQQIDNALLAEGRFYSDLELTEKEIERTVMEASRAEYLAGNKSKQHVGLRGSSTSIAEPSSSGARPSDGETEKESGSPDAMLSSSMRVVLTMGFGYLQVIEAYSVFGDDVDSMVCYLLETSGSSRRKGKATE